MFVVSKNYVLKSIHNKISDGRGCFIQKGSFWRYVGDGGGTKCMVTNF